MMPLLHNPFPILPAVKKLSVHFCAKLKFPFLVFVLEYNYCTLFITTRLEFLDFIEMFDYELSKILWESSWDINNKLIKEFMIREKTESIT